MAIEASKISEQIFKIMKSYGFSLKLYDTAGNKTVNPEQATRFYSNTQNIMVNLDTSVNPNRIKINLSSGVDLKSIKNLLDNLRALSKQYMLGYTLRTFGKKIFPKDFAYQTQANSQPTPIQVIEGFVKPTGSQRTSKQKFGETTLVIKHRIPVDDSVRGARSRHIHQIFIENKIGERFNFPYPSMAGARAMTVHIDNGGNPYDVVGKHITEMCEEFRQLKKFNQYGKRNLSERHHTLMAAVASRLDHLSICLRSLNSQRNYSKYVQETRNLENSVEVDEGILQESGLDSVDAQIQSAMPYVSRLLQSIKNQIEYLNSIRELMTALKNMGEFRTMSAISTDDPEHPSNLTFTDSVSRLQVLANYLQTKSEDKRVGELLATIADDIHSYGDDLTQIVTKLLTSLEKTATVAEQSGNADGLLETHILEINKVINRYSFENTFK